MKAIKSISIFCGSGIGNRKIYLDQAINIGEYLARKKITVVYGGAKIGLMGALADAALQHGGKVIGIIPDFLKAKEIAHLGLSELHIVKTMHERKSLMSELSDGVLVLPGGFGTMDELFEMLTWGQLGLHCKPIGILNVNGYFDALISFVDKMVEEGFLKHKNRSLILMGEHFETLLSEMENYQVQSGEKWITKDKI